ncbi:D-alanyl-D-alanine carboxypeptidase [Amycolatopsis mediterranei S699]|uniref:D-alanyl-D-alanine carboxypeptidase/D-alanyl-D-alanine endopeptidase n=1 Tax=Amycolatopsis mediterranei TaxID=33910 RepID=UPI000274B7E9|nr:D-alanyl-D-alanine carboxypeptidase/D-alanyl-D-alanine-endopeptidase [Amycolatopsis mediterranei]AFO82155.1 D-alanyl-D-alanine carboxypeptidase [Amycolatopsis mediterranei S699]AGT89284.1 D-alanyl-D-alanine carboxypeptidase [Amycolatopsis mediterranei RB]KDO08165.1 peptidase M15 [Amycolatopsis mediterranei]KDU93805.1 peptidase M15 [Amycolatopsis mediterranei]
MPENDQPMWPSSDEDRSSSGARETTPMSLPDPPKSAPGDSGVPKVTGSQAPKGSWFAPNVPPAPVPGLNAPVEEPPPPPSPAKQDLADRLGSREPKQQPAAQQPTPEEQPPSAEPAEQSTQYIRVEQSELEPAAPASAGESTQYVEPPEPKAAAPSPAGESTQYVEPPEPKAAAPSPAGESTQYIEVKPSGPVPVVPIERHVPPREEPKPEEPQQQWREELQHWREEQQRREEQLNRGAGQRREEPEAQQQPAAPWSQRLELREDRAGDRPAEPGDRRPALPPEPPRGVVPSASAGSLARPQRIEPDGQRFDAEATVGIERPTQFPGVFQQQPQLRGDQPRTEQRAEPPAEPPTPPAAEAPAAEEPPKKKRRKGKLIALVVVVLLVLAGGGVAAATPKVANRLGLPWAPNAPKGDPPSPSAATRQLQGPATSGTAPTANGVKSAVAPAAGNSALGQLTGSVIDPVTGTVLWDHGSSTPVTPASTTKVLTSAAALLSLDQNLRLSTKIVQGADPGTVILVGGGDTTLTSLPLGTDSPLYPGGAHVDDLVAQVKKAAPGVKKVQVDLTLFKGATTAPGWEAGDAPSTYATQMSPVMADGGRINAKDNNSQRIANAGSALASTIASKLGASAGGQATAPKDAKVVGEVKSAPLTELVSDLMVLSDDVLAEAIARQIALANGEEASYAGGAKATIKVLKDHGFDVSGVVLSDGSGISVQNRIPARLLTQLLAAAAAPEGKNPGTAKLRPVLAGLPVAGGSGTLADKRFDAPASQAGRGWVRAKTGTLTGVNTLAGLVLDQDGRVLVFAFMSNGSDTDSGRAALDALATSLRKCGCA